MGDKRGNTIFITITLYLLLALSFFSEYFVGEFVNSIGALLFILGASTLIPLTIIYLRGYDEKWAWFSMFPFILILLFNLTRLYGIGMGVKLGVGFKFLWSFVEILVKFVFADSVLVILILMLIFLIHHKIKLNKESMKLV